MKQYYIQDVTRSLVGRPVMWWKYNNHGYVYDVKEARVWSEEDAIKECKEAGGLQMWEKEYIDSRVQHFIQPVSINTEDLGSGARKWDNQESEEELDGKQNNPAKTV